MKDVGKVPSVRERLIRLVIGARRESRQDFISLVGMESSGQVRVATFSFWQPGTLIFPRSVALTTGGGGGKKSEHNELRPNS